MRTFSCPSGSGSLSFQQDVPFNGIIMDIQMLAMSRIDLRRPWTGAVFRRL